MLQRGDLASVESLLRSTVANLRLNQGERAPEVAEKIEECITVGAGFPCRFPPRFLWRLSRWREETAEGCITVGARSPCRFPL